MTVEIRTYVSIMPLSWSAQAEVVFYGSDGLFLAVTDDYPRPSDKFIDEDPPPSTQRLPGSDP